ncbi:hypothetical protein M8J77_016027 [Diaphorina citri]|nr:hypothetical protein M8J77_016027 [Diaphorina citri]
MFGHTLRAKASRDSTSNAQVLNGSLKGTLPVIGICQIPSGYLHGLPSKQPRAAGISRPTLAGAAGKMAKQNFVTSLVFEPRFCAQSMMTCPNEINSG